MSVADVHTWRRFFPALEREIAGAPVAYFDAPGGTQVPAVVARKMTEQLLHHNANRAWPFATSAETDGAVDHARLVLAHFLGARPSEISFGANMTTLTFHLARAIGRALGPVDEVLVTELDHHANVDPWRALARERGVVVRTVRMLPETGQLDWADLEQALSRGPKLLAIGATSNALGTINDVRRASAMAHAVGSLVFVDAVHYAAHVLPDVGSLECDFLACSAYKFYGPHVGVLYARRGVAERLDLPKLEPAPGAPPDSLETGTQNHEGIVGAGAAVEFLASLSGGHGLRSSLALSFEAMHARTQALVKRIWDELSNICGVTLYGPPPSQPRTPTVCFTVAGHTSTEVAASLGRQGLFVTCGDFYATTLAARLGHENDGLVRAGCAGYTTEADVDRLVDAVSRFARADR